jgi:Uma2 family endonuclease
MTATQEKLMTIKEYEEHQLTCESRHEYDNGHLYQVPDETDTENLTASAFVHLFYETLRKQGYHIYAHAVRIAIPNEPKFYYPDVFITKEAKTENNEYVKYEPELIVEVTSSGVALTRNTIYNPLITLKSLR